jgi:hypothetical protein
MNIHNPKVRLVQPEGVKYLTQKWFYTVEDAQEYLNKMIDGTSQAIKDKLNGKRVAPLKTVEQLDEQLQNLYKFKIVAAEE